MATRARRRRAVNPDEWFDPFDYGSAAEAKRARDARYRELRTTGRRARRTVLRGQLEKYRGLGQEGRGTRDLYGVTYDNPPPLLIRVNGRTVGAIGVRQNPPQGGCRTGEVEIYDDVERIYARKGPRSAAPRQRFVHRFRHAVACGRPDGTVILRGRGRRRLWRTFPAEG